MTARRPVTARRAAADLSLCRHEIERLRAKLAVQRATIRRLRAEIKRRGGAKKG